MLNLLYRHLIIYLLCFAPLACFAQTVFEGQVIDSVSEKTLANATVSLIKFKLATQTNAQGYYSLVVNKPLADDTLQISFVGYKTYFLPVSKYEPQSFIRLSPANNELNQVNISGNKLRTLVLDKFNAGDIKDFRTEKVLPDKIVPTGGYFTVPFHTTGTFAKIFEVPETNVKLNAIDLGRRNLDIPFFKENWPKATSSKYARFLMHVILPDEVTGKPGKKIFTKEIALTDNAVKITIDLKEDNIIIPTKKFMIAIEWLEIPINEVIKLNIGDRTESSKKNGNSELGDTAVYGIEYQPFLVLFPSGVGTVGWWSIDNTHWILRSFKSPHPSRYRPNYNLALSATVTY